jgi:hypothetical protein
MGSGRRCAAADGAVGAECSPGEGACPPPRRRSSRAVACVGVWSACRASCEKVFEITTAAAGGGTTCEADAEDTSGCAPGEGACPPAEPPPPPPPPPLPSLPAPLPPLPPLTPSPPSDASQEPQPAGKTVAIQHNVAQWEDTAPMQLLPPGHSATPTANANDCCPTAPRLLYASGSLLFCAGAVLCLMSASLASCWYGEQDDGSEAPQESLPLSGCWLALACVAVSGGFETFWTLCLASYTAHAVPFSIMMGCMGVASMAASLVLHFHARSSRRRRRGSHSGSQSGSHISGSQRDRLHCRNTPLAVSVVLVGAAVLELALVSGLATRPDILDRPQHHDSCPPATAGWMDRPWTDGFAGPLLNAGLLLGCVWVFCQRVRRHRALSRSKYSRLGDDTEAVIDRKFREFDADGNGRISLAEVFQMASYLKLNMPYDAIESEFCDMDADGDDRVTLDEFKMWYLRDDDGEDRGPSGAGRGSQRHSLPMRETAAAVDRQSSEGADSGSTHAPSSGGQMSQQAEAAPQPPAAAAIGQHDAAAASGPACTDHTDDARLLMAAPPAPTPEPEVQLQAQQQQQQQQARVELSKAEAVAASQPPAAAAVGRHDAAAEAARLAEEKRLAEEEAAAAATAEAEAEAARVAEEERLAAEAAAAAEAEAEAEAAHLAEDERLAAEAVAPDAASSPGSLKAQTIDIGVAVEMFSKSAGGHVQANVTKILPNGLIEVQYMAKGKTRKKTLRAGDYRLPDAWRSCELESTIGLAEEQAAAEAQAARIAEERRVAEEQAAAETDLTSSKSTPGKDKYWKDMTTQEQQACSQLGWTPESWDAGDDSPMHRSWASLQAEGIEHWAIAMGWTDEMGEFWDRPEEGEWSGPDSETSEEEEAAHELEDTVGEAVLEASDEREAEEGAVDEEKTSPKLRRVYKYEKGIGDHGAEALGQALERMSKSLHKRKREAIEELGKFTNAPYDHAVFRTWDESNYKQVYVHGSARQYQDGSLIQRTAWLKESLASPAICVEFDSVRNKKETVLKDGTTFAAEVLTDPDEMALYLWTWQDRPQPPADSPEGVYKLVNHALLCDDPEWLSSAGYFMRAVARYIVSHPAEAGVKLYRGTRIVEKQKVAVDEAAGVGGRAFRQPIFVAASESETEAAKFTEKGSPILEFEVPAGCCNCAKIPQRLSMFPDEQEWLMPPYTPVEWLRQEERTFAGGEVRLVVTLKVLDGLRVSRDPQYAGTNAPRTCMIMCEMPAARTAPPECCPPGQSELPALAPEPRSPGVGALESGSPGVGAGALESEFYVRSSYDAIESEFCDMDADGDDGFMVTLDEFELEAQERQRMERELKRIELQRQKQMEAAKELEPMPGCQAAPAPALMQALPTWLASIGAEALMTDLHELGVKSLEDIKLLDEEEIEELIKALKAKEAFGKLKKPQAARFLAEIAVLRLRSW